MTRDGTCRRGHSMADAFGPYKDSGGLDIYDCRTCHRERARKARAAARARIGEVRVYQHVANHLDTPPGAEELNHDPDHHSLYSRTVRRLDLENNPHDKTETQT